MTHKRSAERFSKAWWSSLQGIFTAASFGIGIIGIAVSIVVAWPKNLPVPEIAQTSTLGLSFWQDGALANMTDGSDRTKQTNDFTSRTTVKLKRAPFEIHFPKSIQKQGFRMNAWKSAANFRIVEGTSSQAIPASGEYVSPFKDGRALAASNKNDGILYLDEEAFNYISEDRAFDSANNTMAVYYSRIDDPKETYSTTWSDTVYSATNASLTPLAEWQQNLYLAMWQDINNDGVMDAEEYEYVTLSFR